MTKSLLLDANVIINICNDSPNTQALKEVIARYDFLYISNLSLFFAELNLAHVERSVRDKKQFTQQLQFFYNLACCEVNEEIYKEARKVLNGKDFEDACQIATALKYKCEVLTSDQSINGLYSSMVKVVYVPKK